VEELSARFEVAGVRNRTRREHPARRAPTWVPWPKNCAGSRSSPDHAGHQHHAGADRFGGHRGRESTSWPTRPSLGCDPSTSSHGWHCRGPWWRTTAPTPIRCRSSGMRDAVEVAEIQESVKGLRDQGQLHLGNSGCGVLTQSFQDTGTYWKNDSLHPVLPGCAYRRPL
jgi:hypothetical protein